MRNARNGPTIDNEWDTIANFGALCTAVALVAIAVLFWPEVLSLLP